MAIGDWVIGDFAPSNVVDAFYTQKEVTLTCASFKKDDGSDPVDEILQIQSKVAYGYDNSDVIGGTILQSYNPDDIVIVTDGFESFYGVISNVITPEDQMADNYIRYQIKIARFVPPKEAVYAGILPDGDETIWDDDWEMGYEKYGVVDCTDRGNSGGGSYVVGQEYPNLNVYSYDHISGVAYDPKYGWLMVPAYRHKIPNNLVGYSITIDLGRVYKQVVLNVGYGGQGKPVIGEFGEVTYVPANNIRDAKLTVNDKTYNVPWKAGESQNNIIVQSFYADINSQYLFLKVEVDWIIFQIQSITPLLEGQALSDTCIQNDNTIPVAGGPLYSQNGGARDPYYNTNKLR